MLVHTIFSLFKVNQETVDSLFVQVQCASAVCKLTNEWYFTIL